MRRHLIVASAGMIAMALLSGNAWAVSSDPDPLTSTQVRAQLAKAETSIEGEQYRSAIKTLKNKDLNLKSSEIILSI